jgi:ATP-dependent protease ClpP protease subunit
MLIYNIPIIGIIGSKPENDLSEDKYFSFTDLLLHLKNAAQYQAINLVIDSPGGYVDVAEKMCDSIRAFGKMVFAENSGDVMSAALTIFLLADKQNRKFNPKKGQMLAHFPWGMAEGEANEILDYAKDLKRTETNYVRLYAERTGIDENIMQGVMSENTPLSVEQIEAFGFARIVSPEILAMAFYKQLNINQKMEQKQFEKEVQKIESKFTKLMKFLGFKMIVLTDATGNDLDFGEIKDISEIVVGVPVTVAGSPANGEYIMPDGLIYVCENGLLTEIKSPEPTELDLLKAENEKLKSEIGTQTEAAQSAMLELSTIKEKMQKEAEEIKADFANFKAQFKPLENTVNAPAVDKKESAKMFIKLKPRD